MTSVVVAPFSSAWRDEPTTVGATTHSAAIADPFMPIYRRGDKVMAWMVAAHLALAGLLAPIHDTWRVTAVIGLGAAAIYFLCMGFAGGRFLTRNVAGLVLQTFCALHIYQMQGLAEMHFFFFTAVTAMIVYQDWKALWLGVLAIIAQHTLFSLWHNAGVHPGGMAFFEPSRVSLLKITFHFGIALAQVAFAAWVAHIWRSTTERSFALARTNDRLRAQEDRLQLHNASLAKRTEELEEQLRQSRSMDAVGRMAGGVAHDFNNLLMVIQSHADFMLSASASEPTRRADIEQIQRAADSGAQLARQLMGLGRTRGFAPAGISLNDAVGEMIEMVTRLVGSKIEVTHIAGRDLAQIWAAPGQIQQVLLNLVVNARDAMPNGGQLRIETANVSVGDGYQGASANTVPAGEYVMLAVEDTGIGMTSEVRARLFEPFFTTKDAGQGTGLGLATVDEIVKRSNGHLWVHSEPGVGTSFKIFFPRHRLELVS